MSDSVDEIMEDIRFAISAGNYVFKKHALLRVAQRGISVEDAKHALQTGKITGERWNDHFQTTDFAVEGKALDDRLIRVIVAFERTQRGEFVVIITVIDLSE